MGINLSIEFTLDHVAEVTSINGGLGGAGYGLLPLCVPGHGAEPVGVSIAVPVARPRRDVTRFRIAVPDHGFTVLGPLIDAVAERGAGEAQQRTANKKESRGHCCHFFRGTASDMPGTLMSARPRERAEC